MRKLKVIRVYDLGKKGRSDFYVLVDRLWPRGFNKEDLQVDTWMKEITPSNNLRKFFHNDKDKNFSQFCKEYERELQTNKNIIREQIKNNFPKNKNIYLLTAVKDLGQSHVPVLLGFLEKF